MPAQCSTCLRFRSAEFSAAAAVAGASAAALARCQASTSLRCLARRRWMVAGSARIRSLLWPLLAMMALVASCLAMTSASALLASPSAWTLEMMSAATTGGLLEPFLRMLSIRAIRLPIWFKSCSVSLAAFSYSDQSPWWSVAHRAALSASSLSRRGRYVL